jgi:hypothetical protein
LQSQKRKIMRIATMRTRNTTPLLSLSSSSSTSTSSWTLHYLFLLSLLDVILRRGMEPSIFCLPGVTAARGESLSNSSRSETSRQGLEARRGLRDPERQTNYGRLKGTISELPFLENKRVERYLGVPYAKPPIGDLRFEVSI